MQAREEPSRGRRSRWASSPHPGLCVSLCALTLIHPLPLCGVSGTPEGRPALSNGREAGSCNQRCLHLHLLAEGAPLWGLAGPPASSPWTRKHRIPVRSALPPAVHSHPAGDTGSHISKSEQGPTANVLKVSSIDGLLFKLRSHLSREESRAQRPHFGSWDRGWGRS